MDKHLSLHYGLWMPGVRSFQEAILTTNKTMSESVGITAEDSVLDAGCGVGGAAISLAKYKKTQVTGISLSERQVETARKNASQAGVDQQVSFRLGDYTQMPFADATFTVVWACESVCHAENKQDFLQEAHRVLKPGGRLVIMDFFQAQAQQSDPRQLLARWGATWGVPHFAVVNEMRQWSEAVGFDEVTIRDFTKEIRKSARRLYWAAKLGSVPSRWYNFTHPGVSRFARTHYQSGLLQYKALKAGLWRYGMLTAVKN